MAALATVTVALVYITTVVAQRVDFQQCYTNEELINGCSVPWGFDFPYKTMFTPACDYHDVCYSCVSLM